mgnify:CR=1 FL=1
MKIVKYLNVLTLKEKIGFLIYFIIFYLSYFFELIGIGLIVPLLSKDEFDNSFLENSNLNFIFNSIKDLSSSEVLIVIIGLILFKNIFLISANFFNQFLYYKLNARIANDVFFYYANLDYQKLIKTKAHTISRKVTLEVPIFIDNLIRHLDFFSSLILLLLYLSFGVAIFEISILFIIPLIIISYFINNIFVKKNLILFGKERVDADDRINNSIVEFLPGLREILIYGLKNKIVNRFSQEIKKKYKVILKLNFLTKNNKNFFEFFLASIILIFAIYLVRERNFELENYLPLIIFYAVLFVRAMPILADLFSIRQKIAFSSASVDETFKDLIIIESYVKKNNLKDLSNQKFEELELKNINFAYGNNYVFENLNYKISSTSKNITLIFGKNGSGKSTLINLLTGILKPLGGECIYNSKKLNFENLINLTSLSAQDTILFNGTLKENITMNFFSNKEKVDEDLLLRVIKLADLEIFIESFSDKINHHISDGGKNLSGGQKQRIGFARALYKNSKILILDEPSNNLDTKGKETLIENILEISKEKKIIIATHDKDLIKLNNISYEIKDKKLFKIND